MSQMMHILSVTGSDDFLHESFSYIRFIATSSLMSP